MPLILRAPHQPQVPWPSPHPCFVTQQCPGEGGATTSTPGKEGNPEDSRALSTGLQQANLPPPILTSLGGSRRAQEGQKPGASRRHVSVPQFHDQAPVKRIAGTHPGFSAVHARETRLTPHPPTHSPPTRGCLPHSAFWVTGSFYPSPLPYKKKLKPRKGSLGFWRA